MQVSKTRLLFVLFVLVASLPVAAQTVTGTVTGTVVDPSELAVPKASVSFTNEETGDQRTTSTDSAGNFVLSSVQPGRYTISVQAAGFKKYEKTNLNLTPNERLFVGKLSLEVGAVTESVVVTAQGSPVQVESQERSAELTGSQLSTLMVRGRNYTALLKTLPGVVPDSVGDRDWLGSMTTPVIGGSPAATNSITIDGLPSQHISNPNMIMAVVNMDAVSEVKVLLNNYNAEYGRNGGAVISSVTKSGTRDFHGTAYYYKRHEQFNANSFFNNTNGVVKPQYRFNTEGANIGGPVYWPGKFNSTKDKLFFFYSEDLAHSKIPNSLFQYTMPTALERAGNFSQTLDTSGKLVAIRDPSTNAPFPGNIVPQTSINLNGQKFLSLFPLPNMTDRTISKGNYNYNFQESAKSSSRQELFRIDYDATSKLRMYFRGDTWKWPELAYGHVNNPNWPFFQSIYQEINPSGQFAVNYTVSPTVVMEATFGTQYKNERFYPTNDAEFQKYLRSYNGISIGQLYPANNPSTIIPTASFSGVPGAPSIGVRGDFPDRTWEPVTALTYSVTKIQGPHTLKAGLYGERARTNRTATANFAGNFDFGNDANNPGNTNWAFSNALIGNFRTYTETDSRPNIDLRALTLQWYMQDTWKATKRLTLEYGIRFSWAQPYAQSNDVGANFIPSQYAASQKVVLFQPVLDSTGTRVARNPLTGQLGSVTLIGGIVPGSGNTKNGLVSMSSAGIPHGFIENPGVMLGPRFGFAYDVFGDGKMAVRAGGGILYESHGSPNESGTIGNTEQSPTLVNGNLSTFVNSSGVLFPSNLSAVAQVRNTPTFYNYSFGVQRQVGFQTVLDVAYVATLARNLYQSRPLNNLPYGARFQAAAIDPTTGKPLPDNYLRPILGYGSISLYETGASSNYHSLQVQANRRFAKGVQFGANWTWSKMMDYTGAPQYLNYRVWGYGKSANDRTHQVSINFLYDVPKGSRLWNSQAMRLVTDNWQLSSIASFISGGPSGVSFTTVDGADLTGGGDGGRIWVTGAAPLAFGDRSFSRWFNTSVFARPAQGSWGNAPKDIFRNPGIDNWDVTLFKNFPIRERASFQFRAEMYNALNHTQYNSVDSTARFDAAGNQVNARFGQVIGTLEPRKMQLSLRFNF